MSLCYVSSILLKNEQKKLPYYDCTLSQIVFGHQNDISNITDL